MKVNIGPYVDEGERQVEIQIDRYDTWGMDETLAHIILPMLKQLQETKQGAPYVDWEDVPHELRTTHVESERYKTNGETDAHWFDRWDYVMEQMIWSFANLVNKTEETFYYNEEEDAEYTTIEFVGVGPCQLRLFPDEDGSTEDYEFYEWKSKSRGKLDKEKMIEYNKKMQNGFRLFGKYYQSLWD